MVDHPRIYFTDYPFTDVSFFDRLDGVLIAVAPRSGHYCPHQYDSVYRQGMDALASVLRQRRSTSPLHVTDLSSAGVYGDQQGSLCDEERPPDVSSELNSALVSAERSVLELESSVLSCSILRLGGIYGPNQDFPAIFRAVAGHSVSKMVTI